MSSLPKRGRKAKRVAAARAEKPAMRDEHRNLAAEPHES